MKLLVDAGLVRAEKRGRWMMYSINGTAFAGAVEWLTPFAQVGASGCGSCEVAA